MSITRRSLLLGAAALPCLAAGNRWSICSETFAGMDFNSACKAARRSGYAGIEIEPAHLGPDPASLPFSRRKEIRAAIEAENLTCVGLHSMFKAPAGLHLTTPDAAVRRKTWAYFAKLIDLAADLGDNPVLVLGSSKQRAAIDGATVADAVARLTEGLQQLAPAAVSRKATILMEPLAPHQCNVVHTFEEAMQIVRAVNSPAVQSILDTHNTAAEKMPLAALIRKYFSSIRHVHLNELDGKRPGAGDFPFPIVLKTLSELRYQGWLSVEVFDYKPDGETVARQAIEYLKSIQ
ncbi:MAG TPA: sugar phosphate isomerase/epimerase family protein [Bryobacteraceae bacterium]|nr:sugar phosphate isomerase/epimerase family protein [Bryobacteraceae bacterium]